MNKTFFKFPSTPHLAYLADVEIRSDKVMSKTERDEFLRQTLVVEEKIDGANLGISFNSHGDILLQNRGSYIHLPGTRQWKKLEQWLHLKIDDLFEVLAERYILFGEWCYAKHSVSYDNLPDWFLGFDVYDKQTEKFFSSKRRNEFLQKMRIVPVPFIASTIFSFSELKQLLSHSKVSDQMAEGLYLRIDDDFWLRSRAKLVRPSFVQIMDKHWSRMNIRQNQLKGFRYIQEA